MDLQGLNKETPFLGADDHHGRAAAAGRVKTSLRMRYEAEAKVIRERLGGLDEIRIRLGLSRRKMAELLLVDPSAWTRWTQAPDQAPPWVYRTLDWYLDLEAKDPHWRQWREWVLKRGMRPEADLQLKTVDQGVSREALDRNLLELRAEIESARRENTELRSNLETREGLRLAWKLLLILNSLGWLVLAGLRFL